MYSCALETAQAIQWAQRLNYAVVPGVSSAVVPLSFLVPPGLSSRTRRPSSTQVSPLQMTLCNRNELLAANAIAFMALVNQPNSLGPELVDSFAQSLCAVLLDPAYADTIQEDARNASRARERKDAISIPLFNTGPDAMLRISTSVMSLSTTTRTGQSEASDSLRELGRRLSEISQMLEVGHEGREAV